MRCTASDLLFDASLMRALECMIASREQGIGYRKVQNWLVKLSAVGAAASSRCDNVCLMFPGCYFEPCPMS